MFKQATEQQLIDIAHSCERDAETTLHSTVINKYSAQGKLNVFFIKQHPVGFIIEEVIPPEAELIQLFVFSEYRGAGFGKLILENWLKTLKDRQLTKAFLEVREGNSAAIKIYQNQGFKSVGRRKNYYQLNLGSFDALLMDIDLTSQ